MRIVEGLILLTILIALLAHLVPRKGRPRWLSFLPAVTALLIVIHLVVEGYRWQMVPAYALAAVIVGVMLFSAFRPAKPRPNGPSRARRLLVYLGVVLGLLLLAIAVALPLIMPVFRLPKPSGPYAVGTRYLYLTDTNHPDDWTADPDDFRQVSVQLWYPASLAGDEQTIPYMRPDASRTLARQLAAPEFMLDHFANVSTHTTLGADVDQTGGPYPVITYSTSGLMSAHMSLFEELASHGYVVACIGHPHWNPFVYGANGEAIPFDGQNDHYEAWWDEANSQAVESAKSLVTQARTSALQEQAFARLNKRMPLALVDLRQWSDDIGFVLDQLDSMNEGSGFLAGSLDLERVGVMGFSKGGAAAGQFCATDERCQAGINLTGFMYGDIVEANLETPFFFMSQEDLWCQDCFVNDLLFTRAEQDAYQMKIRGARHTSFGDWILFGWLVQQANEVADIDGGRMIDIQNAFSLAFYDMYLKGVDSALLDDPSTDYPEVLFSSNLGAG